MHRVDMRIGVKQAAVDLSADHADADVRRGFFDFAKGKRADDVVADFAVLAQKQNAADILRRKRLFRRHRRTVEPRLARTDAQRLQAFFDGFEQGFSGHFWGLLGADGLFVPSPACGGGLGWGRLRLREHYEAAAKRFCETPPPPQPSPARAQERELETGRFQFFRRPIRSVIPAQAGIFFRLRKWWFYPLLPVIRSRFPPARE